jgi:hypothetical protein
VALADSVPGNAFMELADKVIEKVRTRNELQRPTVKLQITK